MTNPFAPQQQAPATAEVQAAPVAPVAEAPVANVEAAPVEAPVVKKVKTPRTPNRRITEEEKIEIINRYQAEDLGVIAKGMGLTRNQAYNVVRKTRLSLEAELKENPNMSADRKQKIETILNTKLKAKEFNAAIGGSKTNAEKVDDLLSALI